MDTEVHTDTSPTSTGSTQSSAAGSCGEGMTVNIEDSTNYNAYIIRKQRRKDEHSSSGSSLGLTEWCRSEGIDPVTYMFNDKGRRGWDYQVVAPTKPVGDSILLHLVEKVRDAILMELQEEDAV